MSKSIHTPSRWTSLRLLVVLAALGASLLATRPAQAVEDELTIGLGPGYGSLRQTAEGQSGFGGALYGEYRLTDFWGVTAGAWMSYHLSDQAQSLPGQRVAYGWLGGLYTIDITSFVPFVSLAGTLYNGDPTLVDAEGSDVTGGIKMALGLDYRRYRYFSVGVEGNLHAFLGDVTNYPVLVTTLVRFNFHYEL